jgi:hypothetical protein
MPLVILKWHTYTPHTPYNTIFSSSREHMKYKKLGRPWADIATLQGLPHIYTCKTGPWNEAEGLNLAAVK